MLHTLQSSGESYDLARETLKNVSVDASGKVELEDWVEVCKIYYLERCITYPSTTQQVKRQTTVSSTDLTSDESW